MDTPQTGRLNRQQSAAMWADVDRRHNDRVPQCLGGIAKSITQTRPQAVNVGGSFPVTVCDLSPSGVRLNTPHELGVGDVIEIIVESPQGDEPLQRRAKVMWAGQTSEAQWCAGADFIDE